MLMANEIKMSKEGGIADDGMNRDPVSGNEVPSGSLASEVRDDIPAQLSEGEYVVPADVVRYFGVRVFEDMRREAKMGLQQMEQDGRIGGEPVGPELEKEGLSNQDLAGIEKMLSGSAMADGGLMDKLEYTIKNDPAINKIMRDKGSPVAFAEGGVTQALSNSPKKIDEAIDKFMELARQNPSMMEELAGRGIQVNRTKIDQKPEQMQERNSPPETTNPITDKPIAAAAGTYAVPGSSYATSQTYIPSQFNTLGGSQIYQGATSVPFSGQQEAPPVTTVCPPGQIFDEKTQMCVIDPMQANNNNDDDDSKPPEERDYTEYTNLYGSIDWADPEAFNKYLTDVSAPKEVDKTKSTGILGAVLQSVSPAFTAVDTLSKLKAAELIAKASRNPEAEKAAQLQIETFLKTAGGIANSFLGKTAAGNGYGFANAIFGAELKLKNLNINDQASWDADQIKIFKDILGSRSKPEIKDKPKRKTPVLTKAAARVDQSITQRNKERSSTTESTADMQRRKRQNKEDRKRLTQQDKVSLASKNLKVKKDKEDKIQKAIDSGSIKKELAPTQNQSGEFGMNKGGLMKRNKK